MDPGRGERGALQFVGQLQGAPGRPARRRLGLRRRRQAQQQLPPELVVVALVGLDDVAIERGGVAVARVLAEVDELAGFYDGDPPPRETARGPAPPRRPEG